MWTRSIRAFARGFPSSLKPHRLFISRPFRFAPSCIPSLLFPPLPSPLPWTSKLAAAFFTTKPLGEENLDGPVPVDYSSLLEEREFHKLADEILDHIQERVDEVGEECDIEGFDTDHAEGVLTIRLGSSGTYVINKQTPNRQIWLSSPVSGPARFDWDAKNHCWVYRRTKSEMLRLLEKEFSDLLSASITLVR